MIASKERERKKESLPLLFLCFHLLRGCYSSANLCHFNGGIALLLSPTSSSSLSLSRLFSLFPGVQHAQDEESKPGEREDEKKKEREHAYISVCVCMNVWK